MGVVVPGLLWFFGDPQIDVLSAVMISSTIGVFAGVTALGQVKLAQRALTAGEKGTHTIQPG